MLHTSPGSGLMNLENAEGYSDLPGRGLFGEAQEEVARVESQNACNS